MKKRILIIGLLILILGLAEELLAGNKDRSGQAGATELLINPWARSSGWWGCNSASVRGLEAMHLNIAGTAFTKRTEVLFSHNIWLYGSDIKINSFGVTQALGKSGGVLGIGVSSMSFGDIIIRTVEQPEGGIGKFSPSFLNIGLSYAKAFSNSIYGGLNVRIINENTSDIRGQGIVFDAGIQYVTGLKEGEENIKFGISMKNVGPKMSYKGDGITFTGPMPGSTDNSVTMTLSHRSADFELPSLVNIGVAYDYNISKNHSLTGAATFTSNSFTNDQYSIGVEYRYLKMFMVRSGLLIEKDIFKKDESLSVFKGPSSGVTIELPIDKEKGSSFSIDFSFISTRNFGGCYNFGARINL